MGVTSRLVEPADVAAVGFAVARGGANAKVTIERRRDGTWRVRHVAGPTSWSERLRDQAISMSAAVICGADLVGSFVTEVVVDIDVWWVSVRRHRLIGRR